MNKVMASVVLGVALAGSGMAQAGDERKQLAECKAELAAIYGDETRVRLRSMGGGRDRPLNLSVHVPGEEQVRVVCKRGADGELQLMDRDGVALLPASTDNSKITTS